MKQARPIALSLTFLFLLSLLPLLSRAGSAQAPDSGSPPADRAHTLAAEARSQKPVVCKHVKDFRDCHTRYADGCTVVKGKGKPNYDAYLNFLKNQVADSQDSVGSLTGDDITGKEGKLPAGLKSSNHAQFAGALADLGEGNIYTVVGYLYYHIPGSQETCNCKLKGGPKLKDDPSIDKHLGVGFDADLAGRIASGDVKKGPIGKPTEVDRASMIVEMTPFYRAQSHPNWTEGRLEAAVGKQVKVVGQLMVDNDHLNPKEDCAFPHASTKTCWRMSGWELHPVLAFYVCKKGVGCGSDPEEWSPLDDLPEPLGTGTGTGTATGQ